MLVQQLGPVSDDRLYDENHCDEQLMSVVKGGANQAGIYVLVVPYFP